jgi:bifunctional ADP-heptose synthase (sugar kinase/adenylyltransferase)
MQSPPLLLPRAVVTSAYCNPLHVGHLELFELSKAYAVSLDAALVVIVNSDRQALLKKGCLPAMQEAERLRLVGALKPVDFVRLAIDEDGTVCRSLEALAGEFSLVAFTKGGDRFSGEVPEGPVCAALGVPIVDGFGAKIQSSTALTIAGRAGLAAPAAVGYGAEPSGSEEDVDT